MEPKKHLVALECLCVKKAEATLTSTGSTSAKLSCGVAAVRAKITATGRMMSSKNVCEPSKVFTSSYQKNPDASSEYTTQGAVEITPTILEPASIWSQNSRYTGDVGGNKTHLISYAYGSIGRYTDVEVDYIRQNTYTVFRGGTNYIILKYDGKTYYYVLIRHCYTTGCDQKSPNLWSPPVIGQQNLYGSLTHELLFVPRFRGQQDPLASGGAILEKYPEGTLYPSDVTIQFCEDIISKTNPRIVRVRCFKQQIKGVGALKKKKLSAELFLSPNAFEASGDVLKSDITAEYSAKQILSSETTLTNTNIDKYVGDFGDFYCVQKLFPTQDVTTDLSKGKFVGPYKESGNLYQFIDEGVFVGDYDKNFSTDSHLISDDTDFIQPDTFYTDGKFQYKAKLSNVLVKPDNTRFRMRASAPLRNYESRIPPKYTISNIKLLDPSGNLVVHYNDIVFRGDADQEARPKVNYTTFSSAPQRNLATEFYEWQDEYPVMHERSNYTIVFDIKVEALDEAFTVGFDGGFEDRHLLNESKASGNDYLALDGAPMSTQDQSLINPTKNIRISAIEICNSGNFMFGEGYGPRYENYMPFYMEVPQKGRRLERKIVPTFMPTAKFDTGVWPSVSSIWYPNDLISTNNENKCGSEHIVKNMTDGSDYTFATLHTTGPHLDSGKLTLKFSPSLENPQEVTRGAFDFGFDQSTANSWYSPSGAFNTENTVDTAGNAGYFSVESVTLKVRAKKAADSRNFVLDVVGYSDDKLLGVTKAPSGFLQNPSGVQVNNVIFASDGVHPFVSGFHYNTSDFALGGDSLSEKDEHFQASGNAGGDHYSLTTNPVVSSTDFQEYEVPLKIYDDDVKVGLSRNYNVSSLFEHLYLDIYPIPSGASISDIHLLVRIAPQDAFMLSVEGGENLRTIPKERSEAKIFPAARASSSDAILNAGSGYNPISFISGIPHAYTTPSSIKTNYSRRWRGQTGTVNGPFDVDMFSFGFDNPHVPFPFKLGYYDFDERSSANFKNRNNGLNLLGSGNHIAHNVSLQNGNYLFDVVKNIGWRFSSGTLFEKHLPSYTTNYETTDWTSYSNGGINFQNNELYGKIADAFDTAVRISGQAGGTYLNVSPTSDIINTSGGFSVFLRFSPDQNVTGVGYNLFNSGVLLSKWSSASELDFALGYKDGYLTAYAKDEDRNVIEIQDTLKYHAYQYPLSVILTYNDHNQSGLKLYTDNEANQHTYTEAFKDVFDGEHVYLRASSVSPFRKLHTPNLGSSDPNINIGWSAGSGVGMNMFVTDFGISTWESGVNSAADVIYPHGSGTNIVQVNPDRTHKQVTAEEFFNGIRSKFYEPEEDFNTDTFELWNYVNEDTTIDWSLGDFQYSDFNFSFASLGSSVGKRKNRDLISFHINHHGSGYIQYANYAMPENVDSGVAYHTQIENDFLRFHLSDTADNFHSVHRRITKSLPFGYKFTEDALVVDTIVEHETDNEISWNDCISTGSVVCDEHSHSYEGTVGPKLIVSLYTKRQEPRWSTSEPNWGLINRDVHYIPASSDIIKFSSKFSYDELTDTSEQWSLFPDEPRYKEFGEKYFSNDVDDMFLQYDLVYPSGPAFESTINIHSAHVRMEHSNITKQNKFGNLSIFASGGNVLNPTMNIYASGGGETFFNSGILFTDGSLVPRSGLNLNISGQFQSEQSLNLSLNHPIHHDSKWYDHLGIGYSGMSMNISGELKPIANASGMFNLVLPEVIGYKNVQVPLFLGNTELQNLPSGGYLDLFTYAVSGYSESGILGIRSVPLGLTTKGRSSGGIQGASSGNFDLNIFGSSPVTSRFPSSNMTLFIDTPLNVKVSMPLHILNVKKEAESVSGTSVGGKLLGLNLFMANYGGVGSDYLMWYNNNYGKPIDQADNKYASVPVGNEIRGVDLFGYGSCTGNSPDKAIEPPLVTDDTAWREQKCEEGGIFRATSTYTNATASGFGDTVGYSGNYYGIRKFTGLKAGAPFEATLNIVTGDTDSIDVPREFEDWEYGHCGPEHFVDAGGNSGCCNDMCDGKSLVYSGVKLIGDYPLVDNTYPEDIRNATPPSGRNLGDQYGRAVSVVGDIMAVGAPKIQVPFKDPLTGAESQIDDAGAIFLYRRGQDVAGRKADWKMQDKLMLPSGYRKDYIEASVENLVRYDQWAISGNKWNIGQEGRQLGYSLDVCSSGDRETIVAGAPFAKWTRNFVDVESSGLPVSMVVFTDAFDYSKSKIEQIASVARKYDILYKYFSAPWYGGTDYEFQPKLDIKITLFQVVRSTDEQPPVKHDTDFFRHRYISRMDDKELTDTDGYQATYDSILSGVKQEFLASFPHKYGPHSGIPPIVGIFREKSNSAGLAAFYNTITNKNVVDEFIDFYQDRAYASGVIDPEVSAPHNKESGYFNVTYKKSEGWAEESIALLNKTLDSGNLIRQDALRYITSGVGQEWAQPNAYEFQIPPSSGGRVYIFEKESGVFNCVQEIKSFADRATFNFDDPLDPIFGYGIQFNDRYGHSVSISKNSEVISIGSPFTHTPCEIYQRDESANAGMYAQVLSYLEYIGSGVNRYNMILSNSGALVAQKVSYDHLSHDQKFDLRTRNNIQLYKPVFNYGYGHIKSTGTWQFIPNFFLGTSRLGYSTSTSDTGDTVAFGAPTDSTTLFEDTNVWYKGKNTWASYTNAGAVRIFESEKIFPHSGVVEFTRFGNLDRSVHPSLVDQGMYDQMGLYFEPSKLPFARTQFEEIEIPRDAGLAFIITPELDSDSDEVVKNIKDWLALGDRTLVLVGNDPVYEDNGLYRDSNEILNRLLGKLGSRMRITSANTEYESLQDCVSSDNVFRDRWNVTKSHVPSYSRETEIVRPNMFAKGVGHIVTDVSDVGLENFLQHSPCDKENADICNMPIKNLGDIRAEWNSECIKTVGDRTIKVKYKTNWPFHFANTNPAQGCDDYPQSPKPFINRPNEDIVPLLTAAEHLPDRVTIIPARSGEDCTRLPCFTTVTTPKFTSHNVFARYQEDAVAFSLLEDSDSNIDGVYNSFEDGKFIDPDRKNERDPILQGSGELYSGKPVHKSRTLLPESILALQERYYKVSNDGSRSATSSDVIIMASLLGENERSFGITGNETQPSKNDDQNVLFYVNMLAKNCDGAGKVLQLGGWTGHNSFKTAYSSNPVDQDTHSLVERLRSYDIEVEENFIETDLTADFPVSDPVTGTDVTTLWIANPLSKPDNLQVDKINNFLEKENKKVVITYSAMNRDKAQAIAENVEYICSKLNLKSKPCFVPSVGEYFIQSSQQLQEGNNADFPYTGESLGATQKVNSETIPTSGCRNGYGFFRTHDIEPVDTKVGKFALWPHGYSDKGFEGGAGEIPYIPISGGGDFKKIIYYEDPIKDIVTTVPDLYRIKAQSSITFPVEAGSGYRIFFDWVSEVNNDYHSIDGIFAPAIFDPNSGSDEIATNGGEGFVLIENTILRDSTQEYFDFIAKENYLTVNFSSDHPSIRPETETQAGRPLPPFTPRILSVSGCLLEVETRLTKRDETKRVPCDPPYTEECKKWYEPERRTVIPGEFRAIMHPSDPYCNPYSDCAPRGKNEIQDGPVVAAEELEHFSAGINGNNRSRIVVISDSSMIQGQCPQYRSDSLGENQQFIRGLYPQSPNRDGDGSEYGHATDTQALPDEGRRFKFTQKLRGPERGSAAKYYAVSGITNTVSPLYGHGGLAGNLDKYVDNEDTYHPANPGFEREKNPKPKEIEEKIKEFGQTVAPSFGIFPRFSGDFLNTGSYLLPGEENPKDFIADSDRMGGISDLMKLTDGKDYLDFEYFTSGCPGDLFGFSVDLTQDKLVVGTPFNAFRTDTAISGVSGIVQWHELQNGPDFSGIELCENGGAGSVFYFERTGSGTNVRDEFLPWEWKQKIKPSSINVGMNVPSISTLASFGDHNLDGDFIETHGGRPDQFGYSVAIDADMIAVGAPNHDFESLHDHSIYSSGQFIRKEFGKAFLTPHHVVHDLGSSGVRGGVFANNSGTMILNNGAVFTFRNKINEWSTRSKTWVYAEKLYAQGHRDRTSSNKFIPTLVSGCENDHFGWSIGLNRAKRGDSDYTLIAGAPFHDFATSGDHPQSATNATPVNGLESAGASYTFDAMLREQTPSIPNSGGWIEVEVFGDKGESDRIKTRIYQPTTGPQDRVTISGLIFANQFGNIFLEVSGYDPAQKGFIAHRPYVESVVGKMLKGTANENAFRLFSRGKPNSLDNAWPSLVGNEQFSTDFSYDLESLVYRPSGMSLFIPGPSSVNVYNNGVGYQVLNDFGAISRFNESGGRVTPLTLSIAGISGFASGNMPLFLESPSGLSSGFLNLNLTSTQTSGNLDLNIRGR